MSSTTVIILALMFCVAIGICAWVYIQTQEENQAYIQNGKQLNTLRGEIGRLTREKNELNTRLYGLGEQIQMSARTIVELKAAIDWLKTEVNKPQKVTVSIPNGVSITAKQTVRKTVTRKKATKKKIKKKAPIRKKKTKKKATKKASRATVRRIQSQLSQLSH